MTTEIHTHMEVSEALKHYQDRRARAQAANQESARSEKVLLDTFHELVLKNIARLLRENGLELADQTIQVSLERSKQPGSIAFSVKVQLSPSLDRLFLDATETLHRSLASALGMRKSGSTLFPAKGEFSMRFVYPPEEELTQTTELV